MSTLMMITTVLFMLLPFFQASEWCLNGLEDHRGRLKDTGAFLDCKTVSEKKHIPYSGIPMAHPAFSSAMSLICLLIFAGVKYIRRTLLKEDRDRSSKIKELIWFVMVAASIVDFIIRLIFY